MNQSYVYVGEYIGLTGVRLDGAEMLALGLGTHFIPSKVVTSPPPLFYTIFQATPYANMWYCYYLL